MEGIGWYTHETLKRIVTAHPEHEFIFFFDRPYHPSFIFAPNVTPVVFGPPARHPLLYFIWYELQIPLMLKRYKADVFLSPDGMCSLSTKVPTCIVIHDLAFVHYPEHLKWSIRNYLRHYSPLFARRAAQIVTVSDFSKQDLVKQYAIDPAKISVSYNGANDAYRPLSHDEREAMKARYASGQEYFVFAGALHPRKNVVNLLKAFVIFKRRQKTQMKLVIAGRLAWKYAEVEEMGRTMPYKEDVIWVGYMNVGDLSSLIGGAYALVYASLFEGFGIPILEALQCGVPSIVSNTSSMPEVGGDACLLADPNDPEDIAARMEQMYKDERLRDRLISLAPAQVARFGWAQAAQVLWEATLKAASFKNHPM
jgi:glycosyltransferase involved in cell wall biosynthesis